MAMEVRVGGPAPEFVYITASGEQKRLSALWAGRPALVLWLRHFG
ncbi:MAG TPA: hypothetical protein VGQ94_03385 [Terriglobales bacterium]|nr:hypothetical protein [Terriglobales bacterium]